MLSTQELAAIKAALDQIRRIIDGAAARDEAEAASAREQGYPTPRLTRQR